MRIGEPLGHVDDDFLIDFFRRVGCIGEKLAAEEFDSLQRLLIECGQEFGFHVLADANLCPIADRRTKDLGLAAYLD